MTKSNVRLEIGAALAVLLGWWVGCALSLVKDWDTCGLYDFSMK
jgi:hypothetical protein